MSTSVKLKRATYLFLKMFTGVNNYWTTYLFLKMFTGVNIN